ncbi:MAG TPA: secretin and TonB N-terminal domain-containing protein, partial [Chitinophagaceae bacterium]|nr:secretin and TonB N-terminal domain-containing protein [Chitinophagaceae bacterium]
MKLTAIILLAGCLTVSASGHSQKVTLSLKNVPVQTVFREVIRQTGFSIIYNEAMFEGLKPVSIEVKDATVEEAIQKALKGQPLSYELEGTKIVIKKQENPDELPTPDSPLTIDVKGRIVNEKGEPVAATVQVKGTNIGTSTNENGEFELKGVDASAVLVISGVNIETFEVKVNGRSQLALSAKLKIATGQEVIVEVNTGYQRVPKERATGSFDFINNQLINRSVSTNFLARIENLTPGLLINHGDAANTDQMLIRGRSTIYANAQPLIVLDNFPYDGDFNNINPNDIENITVLKDAAAASIWGARAGNGVIVITTKKGKSNKPHVELNSSVTIQKAPDL